MHENFLSRLDSYIRAMWTLFYTRIPQSVHHNVRLQVHVAGRKQYVIFYLFFAKQRIYYI